MSEQHDIFELERVLNVILNAGDTGATRVKVMADLFLSDRKARSYIDLISRAGLVECKLDNTFYKITPEGREWLEENENLETGST
jgi:predicted transcriptional regulator